MTENPLISVIITTFQRPSFLAKTLKTILSQTYKNLEIIVVDDGSNDYTIDIVNSFKDTRIIFFSIKHSGRPAVPRNFGLSLAKGEFIAFCDDDDLWYPDKIAEQLKALQEHDNIKVCCTNFLIINEKDEVINSVPAIDSLTKKIITFESQLIKNNIAFSTVILHKDVLTKGILFNENPSLRASEDYLFLTNIAYLHNVYYISKPLIKYRIHKHGISYAGNSIKNLLLYYYRLSICMCNFFITGKLPIYKLVFLLHFHLLKLVKVMIFPFYNKLKIWRANV